MGNRQTNVKVEEPVLLRNRTSKRTESCLGKARTSQKNYVDLKLAQCKMDSCDSVDGLDTETTINAPVSATQRPVSPIDRSRISSSLDDVDLAAIEVDHTLYKYPFENIILEGGGNKGLAYCGAIRVLEEIGAWEQVVRMGGASAGAMSAALLSVGYSSYDIEEFLSQDLRRVFLDATCGYFSLLPNLVRKYGWNPGKRIFKWFGQKIADQTGDPDSTFQDIYEKYGKELCVIVTNLNQMSTEYCHMKTTPDLSVRLAVRMSMAIPGMFTAAVYNHDGNKDIYVDGGVLCNYPIHCFDGWWLSMKPEDSYLKRLQPLSALPELYEKKERFGRYNDKTLGFLLYADNEQDVLRTNLEKRVGVELPAFPDTPLAREKQAKKELQQRAVREHRRVARAVDAFLKVLNKHNLDNDDKINRKELEAAFSDEKEFTPKQAETLFGRDVSVQEAFDILDIDKDGIIEYQELAKFIEGNGINFHSRFLGYQRRNVNSFFTFLNTLQSTLLTNVKRIYVEEHDGERTVGINTGYIGTTDFKLHSLDRQFLVEQGRRATKSYLQYYVATKRPSKKGGHHPRMTSNVSSLCPVSEDGGETEAVATNLSTHPATNTRQNGKPVVIEMDTINAVIETNESSPMLAVDKNC